MNILQVVEHILGFSESRLLMRISTKNQWRCNSFHELQNVLAAYFMENQVFKFF